MQIKALFPDHTIPFLSVKKILSRWYAKDTIVSVLYRASGITIDMPLSMFYESIDQLTITNKVFGIKFDERYMLVDAEFLKFTQVSSDDIIMKIWNKPRKSRLGSDDLDINEEGVQPNH